MRCPVLAALAWPALLLAAPQGGCPAPSVAHQQGFDAAALCAVVRAFDASALNYHSLLVERHGVQVAEAYRAGRDRSIYSLFARTVDFGPQVSHDMRSISKSVTSLLWGIAAGQGLMPSVDTPVTAVLPELADPARPELNSITIEHLLNMSSGLAWNEPGVYNRFNDEFGLYWRGAPAGHVLGKPVVTAPGTRFNYNGGGTAILAQILEQRTGMALPDYAQRYLFGPLGITAWSWQRDLRGRALAFAGLRLRPRDLQKLGRLMLQQGRWEERQVVPAAWVAASLQPRLATGDGLQYGYQWWMGSTQALGLPQRWVAGFGNGGQRLFIVPGLDMTVVVTAGEYDKPELGPTYTRLLDSVAAAVEAP
ncbi:serine hydrolase domain-containing protein [Pseudoduganella armeniaca]|uniref:Serine hydrolase n=1 Tax=Pseudoduganella armeniaca TaxID=2072590 RepID=A0A2R4C9E5_9BURK|nr:serine hydrolase [Pseudoduganella armeniaca]AVR96246.1 serine hydrolase [Pseudoduganella armeniaca]